MKRNALIGVLFMVFLTGCVTSQGARDIKAQELQNRINYLESEVQRKDKEIKRLTGESEKATYVTLNVSKDDAAPSMTEVSIQTALKKAGFYDGLIDGKIGAETKKAIKVFQRSNGLKPDGVIGSRTWAVLSKYL